MDEPTSLDAPSGAAWSALVLEIPSEHEDELTGRLAAGSLGAELSPAGPGSSELRVYLRRNVDPQQALQRAREALRSSGLEPDPSRMRVEGVRDGRWVERYQASLQPIDIGRRFRVYPAGEGGADSDREPILLIPGRAFGTGEHSTTQLCAEALERYVDPESRWLDLGCGSGILSVVAHRLGAGEVLAVDHDPEAAAVVEETLQRNGLAGGGIAVGTGSVDVCGADRWDGIVCNIQASFFLEHAPHLASGLLPGGRLIASGFLGVDREELAPVFGGCGLIEVEWNERDPWAGAVLERPGQDEAR